MKRLFAQVEANQLLLILFLCTTLPSIGLVLYSRSLDGWAKDVALNVGFLLLGVVLTVFLVDRLITKHEDRRWASVNTIASVRIRRFATSFIESVGAICLETEGPGEFFVAAWKNRMDPRNHQMELFQNPKWIAYVMSDIVPASRLESGYSEDTLRYLIDSLNWYLGRIREHLSLFPHSLTPTQAANLAGLLDEIPEQIHLMTAHANGNDNFAFPNLSRVVSRSLDLIMEVNRNRDTMLPLAWTIEKPESAERATPRS